MLSKIEIWNNALVLAGSKFFIDNPRAIRKLSR